MTPMPALPFVSSVTVPEPLRHLQVADGIERFVGRTAIAAVAVASVVVVIDAAIPGDEADAVWLGAAATIILAARYAGFWPSLLVAFGTAVMIGVLLLHPRGEFAVGTIQDIAALFLFLAVAAAGASSVRTSPERQPKATVGITPTPDLIEPLTEREREILGLLVEGLSNGAIAAHLVVSPNTVKTHLEHLYGKLGVSSRLQASARARELGLIRQTP
jgi:DNA-binding CsgD family transcriptional regulator